MVIYFYYVYWGGVIDVGCGEGIGYVRGRSFVEGGVNGGGFKLSGVGVCRIIVCGGRLSGVMNCVAEACMVVSRGVVSEGSFLNSVDAGRRRVALSVSMEVRSEVLGPGLYPFGNLAMITIVGWMYRV